MSDHPELSEADRRAQAEIPPPDKPPGEIMLEAAPVIPVSTATKRPKAAYFQIMAQIIAGINLTVAEFPERLFVVQTALGKREAIRVSDADIAEVVPIEHVANLILNYSLRQLQGHGGFQWDMADCRKAADFWLNAAKLTPMPPPAVWLNDRRIAFSRLPWPEGISGPTPLFDELFERISNARAVKAWIGSLFELASDRQQYVWIYGDGQDGKGALSRFLKRVLSTGYRTLQVPNQNTARFWGMQLTGLRLGVFADCDNPHFTRTGFFKSLTGDDPIVVEEKGGGFWTKEIEAKFMFLANERPRLSSSMADRRRIIFSEIQPFDKAPDPTYERRLYADEGGRFLTACIALYRETCPHHGRIPTEHEALENWISIVEEDFAEVADRRLVISPASSADPSELWRVVRDNFKSYGQQMDFLKWLERKHGVKKRTSRQADGSFPKRYVGCSVRKTELGSF